MFKRKSQHTNYVFKLSKREVLLLAKTIGLPREQTYNLLVNFISMYKGNVPPVITGVPEIIYNGQWFGKFDEFLKVIKMNPKEVATYMKDKGIEDKLKAVENMAIEKREVFFDRTTGHTGSMESFCEKYQHTSQYLLVTKMVGVRIEQVYPNNYSPFGYCARPRKDFKQYLYNSTTLVPSLQERGYSF